MNVGPTTRTHARNGLREQLHPHIETPKLHQRRPRLYRRESPHPRRQEPSVDAPFERTYLIFLIADEVLRCNHMAKDNSMAITGTQGEDR